MEKCEENTLQLIIEINQHCKNETEMEEYFSTSHNIFFNFVDHSVDILNFVDPNKKFINKINEILNKDNYNANHLYFNPSIIKSHKGFFFDKIEEELSYHYDGNGIIQNQIEKKKIYIDYG